MKSISKISMMAGIGFGLMLPLHTAFAQELSTEWWQWALSIPASLNPLADPTGQDCMIGQRDSPWFLAGVSPSGVVARTCAIPENTALFFPVINAVNFNSPNVCGQDANSISVATLRSQIAPFVDGATALQVDLDAKPIANLQRIKSPVFAVTLPPKNLFDAPCSPFGGAPAGVYSPAVSDGIYVRLEPLKAGDHTLHFHAESPGGILQQDITYHLVVVPVSQQ